MIAFSADDQLELESCLPAGTLQLTDTNVAKQDIAWKGGRFVLKAKDISLKGAIQTIDFTPSGTEPIFNGKDLKGWSVFDDEKRKKSKFEVTKDGELHVTDGPGDLQTDGKYADFLLQLEVKTNAEGLNSGVFFRCIDKQYQNGYELQIQNSILDGDATKPKDFGTGAIYRRRAAARVVSKDKEWTHITLIAHGDTFASWVNGEPVLSWKDDRKKDENPRKGLRLEAGHISLQGHDPTTDVLFRNIKIVELK